jgi:peptidoglycan/xylan/chitin deacetylase (PgdA/CDA1 family)
MSSPKRALFCCIGLIFYVLVEARDLLLRLAGLKPGKVSLILYYHVVESENRQRFGCQMDSLLRWATPIRAEFKAPLSATDRQIVVTFDDASETVLTQALPELGKRNIPFTIFVIPGQLGTSVDWYAKPDRIMSAEELQQLGQNSLVTIGSHTQTHPALPALTEVAVREELRESKLQLESLLNKPITLFSFPYGLFNEDLLQWCRDAGYERVFTTLPEDISLQKNDFVYGRVRVDPTDWPLEFYLKLAGAYRWLPAAITAKRKLSTFFRFSEKRHTVHKASTADSGTHIA